MWKRAYQRWSSAFREASACVGMGFRDARHGGLWWRSSLWCMAPTCLWIWLYFHYGEFFLKLAGSAALIAFFGMLAMAGIGTGRGHGNGGAIGLHDIGRGLVDLVTHIGPVLHMMLMALALAGFFYVLLFVVANMTTIRLPLRWLFLRRARRVADARYPAWQPRLLPALPRRSAWGWVRHVLKHMLTLIIPVWSLYVVVRFLLECNVWLMYFPAAEGVLDLEQRRALMHAQRPAIFMLGMILCVLMLVPFVNLLLPAVLCSSVCHLQRRGWIDPKPSAAALPS